MDFKIVYEKGNDGWSAYEPDLPGCTSAGANLNDIKNNITEAIELHLEVLKDG